jgi:hypothetical protein
MQHRKFKASILGVIALASLGCQSARAGKNNSAVGTDYLLNTQNATSIAQNRSEAGANSMAVPNPILATGSDVHSDTMSPNAIALAKQLGLAKDLAALPDLHERAQSGGLAARLSYDEAREHVSETLRGAEMDVNYVLAEIWDEQGIYNELVGSYSSERDKKIAITNMVSFGTNGALWAVCEALDIPTVTRPNFAIPSGITGILAGIIPSIASAYTLREVNGKKHSAPAAPNMLAKVFDRPTSLQTEYPPVVWNFLNSNPADNMQKKRKELIIDRWISDSNIPAFTDRSSTAQIDTVTASAPQNKTLTLAVLGARLSMLSQLSAEIFKMNRLLDEMEMALRGAKRFPPELADAEQQQSMQ